MKNRKKPNRRPRATADQQLSLELTGRANGACKTTIGEIARVAGLSNADVVAGSRNSPRKVTSWRGLRTSCNEKSP